MTPFDLTGPLPTGTLVLQASAGTGKTTAIAGLVARYVAEGVAELPQIMIATFSGASTRELRARVREQLVATEQALAEAEAGRSPAAPDVVTALLATTDVSVRRGRVREALASFDRATICTTHQFCDRMLAELGVLVDHEQGTTLLEDLSDLLDQTVSDVYLARYLDRMDPPFDLQGVATKIGKHAAIHSPGVPLVPRGADGTAAERVWFAEAVRAELDRRKRRLGVYTFDDMQLRLRDALQSEQGSVARQLLHRRYPVVLIDEFQDTDPVQWQIVERGFVGTSTVVLIGDPKQSIYGFRGADVLAYLAAVDQADVRALDTNHRSNPHLVAAVSSLFAGAALGDPQIRVTDVLTDPCTPRLSSDGPWASPIRLRQGGPQPSVAAATAAIDIDLVSDIVDLLGSATQLIRPRTGVERKLVPSDVAVIVTTNRRGERISRELAHAGIPSVFNGSWSVFTSTAAEDWSTLLAAFEAPRARQVRAVALTDFVGWTLAQLSDADDDAIGVLAQQVRAWQRVAADQGFAALTELMDAEGLAARVLSRHGGDRALTDLRHVADLLHAQQTRMGLGLTQSREWLTVQRASSSAGRDDRGRRLETDSNAVHVMTVHQAKGLQFPVVYVPEMSTLRRWQNTSNPDPIQVHLPLDGSMQRVLDVGGMASHGAAERREAALREEAGESLRTLYVALTRAECHLTTWWVPTTATPPSPLHRVLFRDGTSPDVPVEVPLDGRLPSELGRLSDSGVAVEQMTGTRRVAEPPGAPQVKPAARFTRTVDQAWRRTSYSALTAPAHQAIPPEGVLDDEPPQPDDALPPEQDDAVPVLPPPVTLLDTLSPMAHLPGGVSFGSLVHAVFETYDPADPESLTDIVRRETARLPVPDLTTEALTEALRPALDTPLGPLFAGQRLSDIATVDRLPELEFELPLGPAQGPGGATVAQIAALLRHHLDAHDPLVDYPDRLIDAGLTTDELRGFLTGSIDATIRVGDSVVVVDYKTNRLAPPGVDLTLGHYTASAMAEAMMASHYPMQAVLYQVALHRFLRWRWRGYRPDVQLGGAAYLFVRGMAGPETPVVEGMPTGVFGWHPPAALVSELSDLLAGIHSSPRPEGES